MRKAEILCALGLLAVAAVATAEAFRLEFGWGPAGPKPGFFIFWLAVLLAGSSLVILLRALFQPGAHLSRPFVTRQVLRPVLLVFLPMGGAVLLFEVVGFYVTAALYLAGYMRGVGRHSWAAVLAMSLLFPLATLFVIERWFLIPLPKGMLGDFLPF